MCDMRVVHRSWDEAILSFDCQRLLGLELDDHAELAHSFVGMAEGYYEVRRWAYMLVCLCGCVAVAGCGCLYVGGGVCVCRAPPSPIRIGP
jgi:hypothetical protein